MDVNFNTHCPTRKILVAADSERRDVSKRAFPDLAKSSNQFHPNMPANGRRRFEQSIQRHRIILRIEQSL